MLEKKAYVAPEIEFISISATESLGSGICGSVAPLECEVVAPTAELEPTDDSQS